MSVQDDSSTILACVPIRSVEHDLDPDGHVVLLHPRFSWGPLQSVMVRWGRPHMRVRLDDVGSFIWLHCDGVAPVASIVERLAEQFGERVSPASERTVRFFRTLVLSRSVTLRASQEGVRQPEL